MQVVKVTDATMCLDLKGPSGKVEVYQRPLLYRSSFEVRLRFTFSSQSALLPKLTQVHLLLTTLDLSTSDDQIAMMTRLVEALVGFSHRGATRDEEVAESAPEPHRLDEVTEKATVELEPGDALVRA